MTQPEPSETRAAEISGAIQRADNDLVLSFLRVRRAIGLLGFFLPAALIAYGLAFGGGILPSMSDYYYSPMREIFVGTLCAIAVFLWSYEGYRPRPGEWLSDLTAARTASVGALAVAWAPTLPDAPATCTISQCLLGDTPPASSISPAPSRSSARSPRSAWCCSSAAPRRTPKSAPRTASIGCAAGPS